MRRALLLLPFAIAACTTSRASSSRPATETPPVATTPAPPAEDEPAPAAPPFALVELFTSEGCSSCPEADDHLAALGEADPRVLTLAFHVDYWDELGWKDPFSQAAFTDRQRAYADALGDRGLYTPEMVVNGAEAFVGSNGARAQRAVAAALSKEGDVAVTIAVSQGEAGLHVKWELSRAPRDAVLAVAVVERARSVRVDAGENRGRTLRHVNAVRALDVEAVDGERGARTLRMPKDLARSNAAVVAWVQSASSMRVLGAARALVGD